MGPLHWCDGEKINLKNLRRRCDEVGAYLIVDGTQSFGAAPFNVQDIRPDFATCSVHKWLFGAYGCSLMYIDPKHAKNFQPIDRHERNRLELGMMEKIGEDSVPWRVTNNNTIAYSEEFTDHVGAMGGRPNPVLLPILNSSLD
eukprot:UN28040